MENKTKYIYGVGVPIALFGLYWFVYRNREPYLDLEGTFWVNNVAVIVFGNNKKYVSLGNNGQMNAGSTYSDKYKLEFTSKKNIMEFFVKDRDGNVIQKQTLDFGAKIRY
jgi:predicted secreted hydrolase